MEEFIRALPGTFIPLFVAMDVFIVLPMFVTLTEGMNEARREHAVRLSVFTALTVSLLFTAAGSAIFRILGITVFDFKIAGGLVLLVIAILDLVRVGQKTGPRNTDLTGVVPLGVPLIVGPAVLTTIIILIDNFGLWPTVASLVLNLLIVWGTLTSAKRIVQFIGLNGIMAISKIMAILLASIAVMMIRLGITGIIGTSP